MKDVAKEILINFIQQELTHLVAVAELSYNTACVEALLRAKQDIAKAHA